MAGNPIFKSQSMVNNLQYRRLAFLALLLVCAFCGLGYRLVDLQVLRHEKLLDEAQINTQSRNLREPRRGEIRDIRGNMLATSVFVKTVCADPTLVGPHAAEIARTVSPLLGMSESEIFQKLQPRLRTNQTGVVLTNSYVVLQRKVKVETWKEVQDAMKKLTFPQEEQKLTRAEKSFYRNLRNKSVFADPLDDQLREYPNDSLAAHILGYVGVGEREIDGERVVETVGIEGIERILESKISGQRGWLVTEKDRKGREMVAMRQQDVEPRDGLNAVLTIDSGLQYIVESELAEAMKKHSPISVSSIVIRPKTGEILAMATLPTFDPNKPGLVPADQRRNRVITDIIEPGSTFKIVVVSGALNDGFVELNDMFDCEHGRFTFAGKVLRDHEGYGLLSVEQIITKSSNIGSAKIGIKMGEERLLHYIKDFGFGDRTGIPLPGEVPGIVHGLKNWNKLSISRVPMGHEVAVTPLQMVMAMSAIANKGRLMHPTLVDRLEDNQGRVVAKYQPQFVREVVSPDAARAMVTALKTVISTNGTAPKAKLEFYTVAGKTGTAQKAGPGGYMPGKYFSSFIGFFPADNPELCISVVMDEPKQGYYGGQTAAPFFRNIAERAANYLNIPPEADRMEKEKPAPKIVRTSTLAARNTVRD
ncbi:MAG TPA: penicillin-binding protein 2 [Roseimicrobium sp.]|nr:penicillin-binding protein 2 [Roseimicrobium sp.]